MRAMALDFVESNAMPQRIARAIPATQVASPAIDALRLELNRIGVNVNQLVRLSHQKGFVMLSVSDDNLEVETILKRLQVKLDGVIDMLSNDDIQYVEREAS